MIRDYGANYYYVKSPRSRKRKFFPFVVLIIASLILAFIFMFYSNKTKNDKAFVEGATTQLIIPSPTQNLKNDRGLSRVVQNALLGTKGNYGIVILNMKTQEFYLLNEHKAYESASLYKLWVMATVMDLIHQGKLKGDDRLSDKIGLLYQRYNLASPSAEENNISVTINDALEKMITVSDNTSALLLSSKVNLINIKNFLNKNGFTGSKLGNGDKLPVTTPYDVAIFLKKVYEGTLINKDISNKMLGLLKQQKLNNKLPKYLPDDVIVAHKTGELDEYTHDAGIIYTPQADYIIVIMSESDPESRFLAEERIANLSNDVYRYFTTGEVVTPTPIE